MSRSRYKDWLDEAIDDYEAAKDLARLGRHSKACFFCHQAGEKALKALMIKKLGVYDTIHSVGELLRRIGELIKVPEELIKAGERLDRFYIPTRYPNAWPSGAPHTHYDQEDSQIALECAKRVMEFVKRAIEEDPE